jgi:multiple sugar transport system ATP-binding protein
VAEVELRNVTKIFDDGTVAVDALSMAVGSGEFIVLLGPSGCGKTTVLRLIAGLDEPTSGDILLDGQSVLSLSPAARKIAMVFQNLALYPSMSVSENIQFPLWTKGVEAADREEQAGRIAAALGLSDVLDRRPSTLSGGQRQQAAMGRAAVRQPELLLLDEPLSNIDARTRELRRTEITDMSRMLGVTTIYVTHNQTEALTMADRLVILRAGVVQDIGTPAAIYARPATVYVASFVGSPPMALLEATVAAPTGGSAADEVDLRLGDQTIRLPWDDPRHAAVARFHGRQIVVGLRAEALAPAAADATGITLDGRISRFEHQGHQSIAYLDIGATALVPGDGSPRPAPPVEAEPVRRRRAGLLGRFRRQADETAAPAPAPPPEPTGIGSLRRRTAELAVRMQAYPDFGLDDRLTVTVSATGLHLFDPSGNRIAST